MATYLLIANKTVTLGAARSTLKMYIRVWSGNSTGSSFGVLSAYTDINNYYGATWRMSGGYPTFEIFKYVGGSYTLLDSYTYTSSQFLENVHITFETAPGFQEAITHRADGSTIELLTNDAAHVTEGKYCGIISGDSLSQSSTRYFGDAHGFTVDEFNANFFQTSLTGTASLTAIPDDIDLFAETSLSASASLTAAGSYAISSLALLDYRIAECDERVTDNWLAALNTRAELPVDVGKYIAVHMRIKNVGSLPVTAPRFKMMLDLVELGTTQEAYSNANAAYLLGFNYNDNIPSAYNSTLTNYRHIQSTYYATDAFIVTKVPERVDLYAAFNYGNALTIYRKLYWTSTWTTVKSYNTFLNITEAEYKFEGNTDFLYSSAGTLFVFLSAMISDVNQYGVPHFTKTTDGTTFDASVTAVVPAGHGSTILDNPHDFCIAVQSSTDRIWLFYGYQGTTYYSFSDNDGSTWDQTVNSFTCSYSTRYAYKPRAIAGPGGRVCLMHADTSTLEAYTGSAWKAEHSLTDTPQDHRSDLHGVYDSNGDIYFVIAKDATTADSAIAEEWSQICKIYKWTESTNTSVLIGSFVAQSVPENNSGLANIYSWAESQVMVTGLTDDRYLSIVVTYGGTTVKGQSVSKVIYDTTLDTEEVVTTHYPITPVVDPTTQSDRIFADSYSNFYVVYSYANISYIHRHASLLSPSAVGDAPHVRRIGGVNPEASDIKAVGNLEFVPGGRNVEQSVPYGSIDPGEEAEFVMIMYGEVLNLTNITYRFYPVNEYQFSENLIADYDRADDDYIDDNGAFPAGWTTEGDILPTISTETHFPSEYVIVFPSFGGSQNTKSLITKTYTFATKQMYLDISFLFGYFDGYEGNVRIYIYRNGSFYKYFDLTELDYIHRINYSMYVNALSVEISIGMFVYGANSTRNQHYYIDGLRIGPRESTSSERFLRDTIAIDNYPEMVLDVTGARLEGNATLTATASGAFVHTAASSLECNASVTAAGTVEALFIFGASSFPGVATITAVATKGITKSAATSLVGNATMTVGEGVIFYIAAEGYRFRNDDGSEVTATWKAAFNVTPDTFSFGSIYRVRFALRNLSSFARYLGPQVIQYRKNSGEWFSVGVAQSDTVYPAISYPNPQLALESTVPLDSTELLDVNDKERTTLFEAANGNWILFYTYIEPPYNADNIQFLGYRTSINQGVSWSARTKLVIDFGNSPYSIGGDDGFRYLKLMEDTIFGVIYIVFGAHVSWYNGQTIVSNEAMYREESTDNGVSFSSQELVHGTASTSDYSSDAFIVSSTTGIVGHTAFGLPGGMNSLVGYLEHGNNPDGGGSWVDPSGTDGDNPSYNANIRYDGTDLIAYRRFVNDTIVKNTWLAAEWLDSGSGFFGVNTVIGSSDVATVDMLLPTSYLKKHTGVPSVAWDYSMGTYGYGYSKMVIDDFDINGVNSGHELYLWGNPNYVKSFLDLSPAGAGWYSYQYDGREDQLLVYNAVGTGYGMYGFVNGLGELPFVRYLAGASRNTHYPHYFPDENRFFVASSRLNNDNMQVFSIDSNSACFMRAEEDGTDIIQRISSGTFESANSGMAMFSTAKDETRQLAANAVTECEFYIQLAAEGDALAVDDVIELRVTGAESVGNTPTIVMQRERTSLLGVATLTAAGFTDGPKASVEGVATLTPLATLYKEAKTALSGVATMAGVVYMLKEAATSLLSKAYVAPAGHVTKHAASSLVGNATVETEALSVVKGATSLSGVCTISIAEPTINVACATRLVGKATVGSLGALDLGATCTLQAFAYLRAYAYHKARCICITVYKDADVLDIYKPVPLVIVKRPEFRVYNHPVPDLVIIKDYDEDLRLGD